MGLEQRETRSPEPPKEVEPAPKVQVIFYGYTHDRFNMQSINHMLNIIHEALPEDGRLVIFDEAALRTRESLRSTQRLARQYGILGGSLRNVKGLSRYFMPEFVFREREEKIRYSSLQDFTGKRSLSRYGRPLRLFTDMELDDNFGARAPRTVYIGESFSKKELQKLYPIKERYDYWLNQVFPAWDQGNFDAVLKAQRAGDDVQELLNVPREKRIVADLATIVNQLKNRPERSVVFVPFGLSHYPMMDELKALVGDENIGITSHLQKNNSPWSVTMRELQLSGQYIPDILYAKEILHTIALISIKNLFANNGYLDLFGNNYNTISGDVVRIVDGLTLEQIREVCESNMGIRQFFDKYCDYSSIFPPLRNLLEHHTDEEKS